MQKFESGQRVVHEDLGAGTMVGYCRPPLNSAMCIAYLVQFDETPPIWNKMSENPTLVFTLKPEEDSNAEV